jgi:hypothetical protein
MAEQDVSTPILFDRDEVEHLGSLSERPKRLNGSTLLWVDIDRRTQASADEMAVVFDLEETTRRRLASSEGRAVFVTHPELEALGNDGSGECFQSLLLRFESTSRRPETHANPPLVLSTSSSLAQATERITS